MNSGSRALAWTITAIMAATVCYSVLRIPLQVTDSLIPMLDAQRMHSVTGAFTSGATDAGYFRPLRAAQIQAVFELANGSGTITALALFNGSNGMLPVGDLVMDGSGNLYGTTAWGGANTNSTYFPNGAGTVFELGHGSSTLTALASLDSSTGDFPNGSLIEDSSGNLFGVAEQGGTNNAGTVFELAQGSNTITVLASFGNASGTVPIGNLNEDSSGNLFGTTYTGGANGFGTLFELSQRPSISMQPQNATATAGQAVSVSLTVAASEGTAPLSYQWQISPDNGATFTNLSESLMFLNRLISSA